MRVSNETIEELIGIINDSLGRTGNELVIFFNQFGFNHIYPDNVHEAGSKAKYTRNTIQSINGTAKLDTIIENALHPRQYINSHRNINDIVDNLNQFLGFDGYEIIHNGNAFTVKYNNQQHSGSLKNLLFASDGPKPEIVLVDTLNYDIDVVANKNHILIYDQPITADGLTWQDLVGWWSQTYNVPSDQDRKFYHRLNQSLASSPPEQLFFWTYYETFSPTVYEEVPALIPQVYLHYDPYTLRQLNGGSRIPRQRMDFLMLLPENNKIVIEIDGKQHYTKDHINEPSPKKYAEMVSEDRRLRLSGYEVYRFGGRELMANTKQEEAESKERVVDFFEDLFDKHQIKLTKINATTTP
ncbi:endonuclease domain-containing protein [Aquibacillus saliphilus]|uniref:endonuclease domain-containing protein n=1 Tax=Aquibacillus saliphilus TaxID=1909422 RepID=UPI001CF0A8D6|nr:endonuclease domain-containing protein [Aquibacillus saliphilus]